MIDIGCGCGDTTLAIAEAVGPSGSVLGVDVSQPMLAVARRRAAAAGPGRVDFREADASTADLPDEQDLLFSRFGVMFFDAPVPAFTHLRRTLRPSGRVAFVCWRAPRDNPWAMAPLSAARAVTPVDMPPHDPLAPGPFAFADETRVRAILLEANFRNVVATSFASPVYLGASAESAALGVSRMGPLSRFMREVGPDWHDPILKAVTADMARHASPDGSVSLPGSTWIVTADAG